jgi:hypothetical protein
MTLKLTPLGANKNEIELPDGTVVFFSYKTPVAARMGDGSGFVKTSQKWSVTTSKHINQWLMLYGATAREMPQKFLNELS